MKTQKISFNAISGVMSRSEMKKIMAGSSFQNCHCISRYSASGCPSGQVIWTGCDLGGGGFPGSEKGVLCCNV